MGRALAIALLAVLWVLGGCDAPAPPPPPRPSAQELWLQGEQALSAGQPDLAADLFEQSLTLADHIERRGDAAVRLAVAGATEPAANLLRGRAEPELADLARALELFQDHPPPGYAGNAYILGPMAEALRARAWADTATEPVHVLLEGAHLANMLHYWQAWLRLSLWESETIPDDELAAGSPSEPDAPAAEPGVHPVRLTAVWVLPGRHDGQGPGGAGTLPAHYIVHRAWGEPAWLAHLGGWPIGQDGPGADLMALVQAYECPAAELHLVAWRDRRPVARLTLSGTLTGQGLVARRVSSALTYRALEQAIVDGQITAAFVVPRDADERRQIERLAARRNPAVSLREQGAAIAVAGVEDESDYVVPGQWLADLASYVRHGRAVMTGD